MEGKVIAFLRDVQCCYIRLKLNPIDLSPVGVMSKTPVIVTQVDEVKAIVTQSIKTFDYDHGLLVTAQGQFVQGTR